MIRAQSVPQGLERQRCVLARPPASRLRRACLRAQQRRQSNIGDPPKKLDSTSTTAIIASLPQPSKLQIAERRVDDVVVLALVGQILLDDGDLEFRTKIHELVILPKHDRQPPHY